MRKKNQLTLKQARVLLFIQETIKKRHTCPSVREIAAHIGTTYTNAATNHIRALRQKGFLAQSEGLYSVRLFEPTSAVLPILGEIDAETGSVTFAPQRKREVLLARRPS